MKMKHFFTFCALLFFMQSCTKGVVVDESTTNEKSNKGRIQMNFKALVSKSDETDELVTSPFPFTSNDSIGLFILKSPSTLTDSRYFDNKLFLCGVKGLISSMPISYYPKTGDACSILAYYPYQKEMIPDNKVKSHFKLPTDQRDIKLHNIDFMVCRKEGIIPSEKCISLTFKHRLAHISLVLQPSEHYNATQLLEYNPKISFHYILSEADYDFKYGRFFDQIQAETIIPNGEWKEDGKGNLIGKSCLLIPESIIIDKSYFELTFNGNKYQMTIKEEDLLSLPDSKLVSGSNIKCILSTNSSDIIGGVLEASFHVDVEDWSFPVEKTVQMEDASEKYCYLKIADIDFSQTQIYHVVNKVKSLYEISRQVVLIDGNPQINIVLIPLDEKGDIIYEKKVVLWEGDKHNTEYLFFDKSWNYSFVETAEYSKVGLEKVEFFDKRMGNTIPLVRIANNIWFSDDFKISYMTNSIPLKLTDDFSKCQTIPAYHKINAKDGTHYVYNKIAITNPNFLPNGYHLPSLTECISLKDNYGKNLGVLISDKGWGNQEDVTNSSLLFLHPNTSYASGRDVKSGSITSFWTLKLNEVAYFTLDYYIDNAWTVKHYGEDAPTNRNDFSVTDTGFAVRLIKN